MKERIITISIFVAVIASSFYFGFHRLESYSGVDEPLWSYGRVPQFWNAIQKMKWKSTTLCDKPGVTLAAISGIGLNWVNGDPTKLGDLRYAPKTPQDLQALRGLYFDLRLPVYLFTLAMLPVFYWLIKRLLGKRIARASIIFIGLSPVLLGISLMINADAVLWSLIPLALLSFLIYQKENNRNFLYLSGFLLGLALIDKYIEHPLLVLFWTHFFEIYFGGRCAQG
jgi:4-amino-4-deoxy-L-arabinose transferase-like glycosyltransferase